MNAAPQLFTASTLARALGKSRQALQQRLAAITPSGQVTAGGNTASAWPLAALPDSIQAELDARAESLGYRNSLQLLGDPPAPCATPKQRSAPKPAIALSIQDEFRELADVVSTFKNPATPTDAERDYLWLRSFELFEGKTSAGAASKKVRIRLLKFLHRNAAFLAKNANALRVAFGWKYDRWLKSDRAALALQDCRKKKSGFHRAPELSAEDRDAIIAHARFNCGGRVSQAWRELIERNALSPELLEYYLSNPASKSYCPTRIREAVGPEVVMLDDIHHGPRTARLNGAHLSRDWSGVASMDWICGDDATTECYFYLPDGKGWFRLTRGQLLLFVDVRTTRILGFAMIPEKTYNARAIRTLITRLADEHGLPRKGFYFERGIWQKSRLLKGDAQAEPFSLGEAELGLRSLGLRFVHSRLPRSKPVERVLGALQDLMDGERGFVGGNEMREKFERIQRAKLLVDSRKVHPSEHFYSLDQWTERLDELCAAYNSARQDGKHTERLSPDDAFDRFERRDDPPIKLPDGCRYLLSHHKRPVTVTRNGITLRFRKEPFNYRNEQTGRLIGQRMLAFFNPETPEILTVTDMNRENPFCIERSQDVPAMEAPAELIEQEMARAASHNAYAKTRYRILKARFSVPFRRTVADAEAVTLGVEIADQQNKIQTTRQREQKQQSKARKTFGRLGMPAPADRGRPLRPGQAEAGERLAQFLDAEERS